jgi:hypothetical protein
MGKQGAELHQMLHFLEFEGLKECAMKRLWRLYLSVTRFLFVIGRV